MSNYMNEDKVLLVGCGRMGIEYAKVLKAMQIPVTVVGRSIRSGKHFQEQTGLSVQTGGLAAYIDSQVPLPKKAIVAVDVIQLAQAAKQLLNNGIKQLLLEKPAGLNLTEIKQIADLAREKNANVYVAYNRRFYTSTMQAKKWIEQDGGATSFHFEFTELSHIIASAKKNPEVKKEWFLANSTHVVDLAFFLGGEPDYIQGYTTGKLSWHPSASVFAGSGYTDDGALFSYHANWGSAGSWSVEIYTKKRRLILNPLEQLFVQYANDREINEVKLQDSFDKSYKPGLYRQVEAFCKAQFKHCHSLLTIYDHYRRANMFKSSMFGKIR